MRVVMVVACFAACSSKASAPAVSSSPPPSAPAQPPTRPVPPAIEPADLSKLEVDPAMGFKLRFEGDDTSVASLKKYEGDMVSKYDVWSWDPSWPADVDGFAEKLKQPNFLDEHYRYDVVKTSATDDAWEFRGTIVHTSLGETDPTFVVVRTIRGKRFLCKGRTVATDAAMQAAIASCRGATL